MIKNVEQFEQTLEAMRMMYRALGDLRTRLLPDASLKYALLAQGPLDELQRMQADVDQYLRVDLILQEIPVSEPANTQ